MATLRELVADILKELKDLQNSFGSIPDNDSFPLPSMIPAGNAGSIIVSRNIEKYMAAAGMIIKDDEKLNVRFGQKDWDRAVRSAFGEALIKINLKNDPAKNAELVLKNVRAILRNREENTRKLYEHAFGCTLLKNNEISPFNIGPVRFETRRDWLQRKKNTGAVSSVTYRRICRIWQD